MVWNVKKRSGTYNIIWIREIERKRRVYQSTLWWFVNAERMVESRLMMRIYRAEMDKVRSYGKGYDKKEVEKWCWGVSEVQGF